MIEAMKKTEGIKAFFSTRDNGMSKAPYKGLNVAFHVGDDENNVLMNHQYIRSFFPNSTKISYMNQIHSNKVCELGMINEIPSCDALITDKAKDILMVMVADCIPILFYDTKQYIIAAIHAGRCGTFTNIVSQTLELMASTYYCNTKDIIVSIGPHIKKCCYEVGEEIVVEAKNLGLDKFIVKYGEKFHLDMISIILQQLIESGIETEKIEIVDNCTCCESDRFFSYRKEGKTGRFCGVIMLE